MVGTFGKQIFQSLMNIYVTDPMDMSTPMNRQELDVKLRVGEALNEIMGKCGQSLGGYGQQVSLGVSRVNIDFPCSGHSDSRHLRHHTKPLITDYSSDISDITSSTMRRCCSVVHGSVQWATCGRNVRYLRVGAYATG